MPVVKKTFVDMHVHTTCSDGTYTPEEVVRLAVSEGIKVLAITDHDNVSGIARAQVEAEKFGIQIIPGIECSTTFNAVKNGTRHILGYNIDPTAHEINRYVEKQQRNRIEKVEKILKKLRALGINISYEDVKKYSAGDSIGRPHIARAMVEQGYVLDKKEAFDKYIGKGGPAYATSEYTSVEEVVYAIIASGGIPILAHPFQMRHNTCDEMLEEINNLVDKGVQGIEAIYPEHLEVENFSLVTLALENDLFITAGSDFHGENKEIKLGKCFFNKSRASVEGLKKLGKTIF